MTRALTRESKLDINKPTPFDGSNRALWRPFLNSVLIMFNAKPLTYASDNSKITFAASYLSGAAAKYYNNLVERQATNENETFLPALNIWSEFVKLFARMFGLHDEKMHAQSQLDKCLQIPRESFADFLVRFEDISNRTTYNDPAKRWRLLNQIRGDLRNRLTMVGNLPETYQDVVDRLLDIDGAREAFQDSGLMNNSRAVSNNISDPANNVDRNQPGTGYRTTANRIFNRNNPNPPANTQATQFQPQGSSSNTVTQNQRSNSSNNNNANNAPAVVRMAWVTQEEYDQRRARGACTYCGEMGHFARECPQRRNNVAGRATFSDNSDEPSPSILLEVQDDIIDIDSTLFEESTEGEENEDYDQGNVSMTQEE